MLDIMDLFRTQQNPMVRYELQGMGQGQSQPVDQNADYLTQLQQAGADQYAQPVSSPVMQMAAAQQAPAASDYTPTTGAQMEADSRNSIDGILAHMTSQRAADRQNDRNIQWMTFFSKLASSKNPRLLGGLGEGAEALADVTGKQAQNNKVLDQSALEDQLKVAEWNREQARQEAAQKSTEAYQKGELGLKEKALEQGHYTITPDGLGGFIKIDNKTGNTETIGNPMGNVSTSGVDASGNPVSGDEYLKTLDPRIARTAKMVANGDMPWPGGFALKSPYWQNVIAAAQTYDPTANGNRFPAVKAFNTGKQGDLVRSLDVATQHLDVIGNLATALDNGDTKLLNHAKNQWQEQFGEEAPSDFNTAKSIVANEVVKSIVGGQNAEGDRIKAQAAFDAAKSPAQLAGAVKTVKSLMKGQINGVKQQYENSTGRKDFYQRLTPTTRGYFDNSSSPTANEGGGNAPKTIHFNDLPE